MKVYHGSDTVIDRIDQSKCKFLEELKFHRPTHQICLCTIESLQTIEPVQDDLFTANIDDAVTQALMEEYLLSEEKAIDFYLSQGLDLIGFDRCCYSNNDIEKHEVRIELGMFFESFNITKE